MVSLVAVSLPGLAALGALLFTWMQVGQASKELRISEHGQITSRFNAAVNNLGSQSLDARLGGVYALQRIMQDSVRDHPTVVSVLAAFAQRHAGSSIKSLKEPLAAGRDDHRLKADVEAAIATLARRRPERDSGTIIDLTHTDLRGLRFTGKASINLPEVDLSDADLRWVTLSGADLRKASLSYANLERAYLDEANLRAADLAGASLGGATFTGATLREADMTCGGGISSETGETEPAFCVDLQYAWLDDTDLRNAKMSNADLREATLAGADLRHADLRRADLTNADFRGAKLTGAELQGAKRAGARGLPKDG
ncbi:MULTISPECIES: pentapeptide repeat-containing protein [unclassified Streptomyces]|uniref:pentapeptide repeat-containing protein n=1 Tax=unclassified Streptomyces TaxID=2593676 RepID=UPI00236581D4|nr:MULTISPECIES: pentapeptide repeat-containing protein [unclassified Streptomyces]MDF3142078.1 pentapeptide repeat-containing protein [Streptomyces sp. T21Q-yed]WDF43053.1 pentapeptide repeat-containing protein [Streptomyces sp. T12]